VKRIVWIVVILLILLLGALCLSCRTQSAARITA